VAVVLLYLEKLNFNIQLEQEHDVRVTLKVGVFFS